MNRTPIKRYSLKYRKELKKRRDLKAELIKDFGEHCMTCGKMPDWRGISLSHIIALSRGGETSRGNCIIECYPDHELYEKHPETRPLWRQIQVGLINKESV